MTQNPFFKKATVLGSSFSLAAASVFWVFGQTSRSLGILVSAAWVFLNSYFLFRLVQIGLSPRLQQSDKILLFSVLKFPVLYLVGFFILKSRYFSVGGILIGLTLFMAAFALAWLHENLAGAQPVEKGAA